jgi:translation initiation factor eIF-2B subunit gamma
LAKNALLNFAECYRLYPLTEDNNVPKALLPIANKPMLHYVLDWLERASITGIYKFIAIKSS